MRDGDILIKYANNSWYKGQFADGKRNGAGVLCRADGTEYDGQWHNDELNGEGTERCPDGTCFTGNYVNGMRCGHGVVTWPEGSKYSGQFDRGKANGEGFLLRTDGSIYKGQFAEDCMSGQGCMKWKDGAEYVGQFLANRRDGSGKMNWITGRWKSYEGDWKDGRQHGLGTIVDQGDVPYYGVFQFGKLVRWNTDPRHPQDAEPLDLRVPQYWTNQCVTEKFNDRNDVSQACQEQIQRLLDGTFRAVRTRDRSGVQMPTRLRLVKCHRVENCEMWTRYQRAKARILSRRPAGCQRVHELGDECGSSPRDADAGVAGSSAPASLAAAGAHSAPAPGPPTTTLGGEDGVDLEDARRTPAKGVVKTQPLLEPDLLEGLDERVNEHFLWHGTTPDGAIGISSKGFRIAFAGTHAGTYFGRGCYFAECSSKADEYAKQGENILAGVYALLLCRVVCGNIFRITHPDDQAIESAVVSGDYDMVLGDREASVGTYREFVVFDEELAYPEFVVLYERSNTTLAK